MFRNKWKVSKREKTDEGWYTLLNSNTARRPEWDPETPFYQVISLDPATRNFAFRVERRWIDGKVETKRYEKFDFSYEDPITCNLSYQRALQTAKTFERDALESHYVISERQLPQNYKAVRMSQNIISFFLQCAERSKLKTIVIEVNPRLKGYMLGAPKGCTDKQLKAWSVEKTTEIFKERNDTVGLAVLAKTKKKDDLADTVSQSEAFFELVQTIPTDYNVQITTVGNLKIIAVKKIITK